MEDQAKIIIGNYMSGYRFGYEITPRDLARVGLFRNQMSGCRERGTRTQLTHCVINVVKLLLLVVIVEGSIVSMRSIGIVGLMYCRRGRPVLVISTTVLCRGGIS